MNTQTKMSISKPAHDIFEAIVDPARIGNFWFSSSSERWEQDKVVTLGYAEYQAQVDIRILEIEEDHKIVFRWGNDGQGNIVTIVLNQMEDGHTLTEVTEEGFHENEAHLIDLLLDNKKGWVYMLTCLKGYLEYGVVLRAALVK